MPLTLDQYIGNWSHPSKCSEAYAVLLISKVSLCLCLFLGSSGARIRADAGFSFLLLLALFIASQRILVWRNTRLTIVTDEYSISAKRRKHRQRDDADSKGYIKGHLLHAKLYRKYLMPNDSTVNVNNVFLISWSFSNKYICSETFSHIISRLILSTLYFTFIYVFCSLVVQLFFKINI